MSLATIRSVFEVAIQNAFAGMTPAVPVAFDNVQSKPLGGADSEFVVLSIDFPSITAPILCMTEAGIDLIRGNVQVACYTPRETGMKRLEEMTTVAAQTLNTLKASDPAVNATVGQIAGPISVLEGPQPHALATLSAPFTARG